MCAYIWLRQIHDLMFDKQWDILNLNRNSVKTSKFIDFAAKYSKNKTVSNGNDIKGLMAKQLSNKNLIFVASLFGESNVFKVDFFLLQQIYFS